MLSYFDTWQRPLKFCWHVFTACYYTHWSSSLEKCFALRMHRHLVYAVSLHSPTEGFSGHWWKVPVVCSSSRGPVDFALCCLFREQLKCLRLYFSLEEDFSKDVVIILRVFCALLILGRVQKPHFEPEAPKSLGTYAFLAVGCSAQWWLLPQGIRSPQKGFFLLPVLVSLLESLLLAKPGSFWPLWSWANRFSPLFLWKLEAISGEALTFRRASSPLNPKMLSAQIVYWVRT